MPPKVKFSREQILKEALNLVREEGETALTTRALGKRLGTTATPIFTAFENVDELKLEVKEAAKDLFAMHIRQGLSESPVFIGVAKHYVLFARDEPNLFRLLFMSQEMISETEEYSPIITDNCRTVYEAFKDTFNLSELDAARLYLHTGIYLHGLASLFAEKMCNFSIEDVDALISEAGEGLVSAVKTHFFEELNDDAFPFYDM